MVSSLSFNNILLNILKGLLQVVDLSLDIGRGTVWHEKFEDLLHQFILGEPLVVKLISELIVELR